MAINFIIGRKLGMTRIFDSLGSDYPVTIVEAGPCEIVQVKTIKSEGYSSIQIGFLEKKMRHTNRSEEGHFKKSKISPKKILKEFRINDGGDLAVGEKITTDIFGLGDFVTVTGTSKGKGFAGHMKRHGFGGGRRSHGKNSVMRKAGSIGAGSDPSRVWPGTRMAGRMGNENVTVKNLEITRIDNDKNLVFVKGAIPGANNGIVFISKV